MSHTKILLDCPICGHQWQEHLPVMDKLTDIYLAAKELQESLERGMPVEGYYLVKLKKAIKEIDHD